MDHSWEKNLQEFIKIFASNLPCKNGLSDEVSL